MRYDYPVVLERDDNGTILVTCPDLPEVTTFGDDEAEALSHAVDAIETAIIGLMTDRKDIPSPSKLAKGQVLVSLPVLSTMKIALYQAMRTEGVRKTDLGRRMGLHLPQVDRLLDLRHSTKVEQLEAALRTLGRSVQVEFKTAA